MRVSPYYFLPEMPKGLEELVELALDLRWSWSHTADVLWERMDPELWEQTRNPWLILQTVAEERLKELAADKAFTDQLKKQIEAHHTALETPGWFKQEGLREKVGNIAYFSMEFGLSEALPIYSGGLGVLAGDLLKTANDLDMPVIGIGLLYQQGYFRQMLDAEGNQREFFPFNNPNQLPLTPVRDKKGKWLLVRVRLPGRDLRLQVWQAIVGRVRLYLMDSNNPLNTPPDQGITSELYGGGREMRLQQEMVLGIGGCRILQKLGIDADIYHLNEGHAAFAVLERAHAFAAANGCGFQEALAATRTGNLFTTHTPVEAGFDRFSPELMRQHLSEYCDEIGITVDELMALGRVDADNAGELFNMAYLATRACGAINGVSRLHGKVSRRIFQPLFPDWPRDEVPASHVTNGVHIPSWCSNEAGDFWNRTCQLPAKEGDDASAGSGDHIENEEFWALRSSGRQQLVHYARKKLARQLAVTGAPHEEVENASSVLDPNILTLCFARRFAEYKRPNLLLTDRDRLARIVSDTKRPVQLIIAGKAHPRDDKGKAMIREWTTFIRRYRLHSRVVFLSDYDMQLAQQLVRGADVWINTPRRPWEACGTSGMKVLFNGGLNLSELDGWWAGAYDPETGWALGDGKEHDSDPAWDLAEAKELYDLLENRVIPEFYDRGPHGIPQRWVTRMRASICRMAPRFSSERMLREYTERHYIPLAAAFRRRTDNGGRVAQEVEAWRKAVKQHWPELHFGNMEVEERENRLHFSVQVYLDELGPDAIHVELYADALDDNGDTCIRMTCEEKLAGAVNGYIYTASVPDTRPTEDYTPRIVPNHPDAFVPLETHQILWFK